MKKIKKIIFILVYFIFAAGCAGQGKHSEGLLLSGSEDTVRDDGEDSALDDGLIADEDEMTAGKDNNEKADGPKNPQESVLYVQVSGAVKSPGVYELPEGSRVFQAIELAGGMTEDADMQSVNQAQPLSDGEMVVVLTVGEAAEKTAEGADASADDGRVNLNTATEEELMELPGIGAAKAAGIIAWREANGSFTQIEDLMKIEGIKEGVFSKLADYVKVQ